MVKESLGVVPSIILIFCLLANVLGAMIAYLIIIGDMILPILQNYFGVHFYTNRAFVTIFFLAIVFFLLSSPSSLSVLLILFFFFLVISINFAGAGANYAKF